MTSEPFLELTENDLAKGTPIYVRDSAILATHGYKKGGATLWTPGGWIHVQENLVDVFHMLGLNDHGQQP